MNTLTLKNPPTEQKPFDYLVFIGRFELFHKGQMKVIDEALKRSNKVIILVGSAANPRSARNPFTFDERKTLITNVYKNNPDIIIEPLYDVTYNDAQWTINVQEIVMNVVMGSVKFQHSTRSDVVKNVRIGLIGHSKDSSSYYLKKFPQWKSVAVKNYKGINSTDLRRVYFRRNTVWMDDDEFLESIPNETSEFLATFQNTVHHDEVVNELEYAERYKKSWEGTPFPVIHMTVDAVVVQSGHILLIRRGAQPGKGLYALPGGFIKPDEKFHNAMIRELYEETRIKVPEAVLRGSIVGGNIDEPRGRIFDDPNRSVRGRVVTYAFLINLKSDLELPKVKGSSDAKDAMWVPFGTVGPEEFFEDHYHIIREMIGSL